MTDPLSLALTALTIAALVAFRAWAETLPKGDDDQ